MKNLNQSATCGDRVGAAQGKLLEHPQGGPRLTDHHVIPYNRLKEVWNTLLANNELDAISDYIGLLAPDEDFRKRCLAFVKGDNAPGDHTINVSSGALGRHQGSSMSWEVIASELFWVPWNLVEGPSARPNDDPGEGTERFVFEKISKPYFANKYTTRQNELERLSEQMKWYLARRNDPRSASYGTALRGLRDQLVRCRAMVGRTDRLAYRDSKEIWEKTGEGYGNAGRVRRNSVS